MQIAHVQVISKLNRIVVFSSNRVSCFQLEAFVLEFFWSVDNHELHKTVGLIVGWIFGVFYVYFLGLDLITSDLKNIIHFNLIRIGDFNESSRSAAYVF